MSEKKENPQEEGWGIFSPDPLEERLDAFNAWVEIESTSLAQRLIYDLILSKEKKRARDLNIMYGKQVWSISELIEKKPYREYKQKKSDGSYRKICAPSKELKHVQYLLLTQFFYRILERSRRKKERTKEGKKKWCDVYDNVADIISPHLRGFLPKIKLKENASPHLALYRRKKYVATIDLKKAFDNISADMVEKTLLDIVAKEWSIIEYIHQQRKSGQFVPRVWHLMYPLPSLFPRTKVGWLRKLIRENSFLAEKVLYKFVELLTEICTYKDALPQGAPTSPFLLNLVVSYFRLPEDILEYTKQVTQAGNCNITMYADDITLSGAGMMNHKIKERIEHFIENDKGFPVNKKKTKIFYVKGTAPEITGLNIATRVYETSRRVAGNGTYKKVLSNDYKIALPKRKIKSIRACIHNAINQEFDGKVHRKIIGYISYARGIYGEKLPNQLWKPWLKYKKKHGV